MNSNVVILFSEKYGEKGCENNYTLQSGGREVIKRTDITHYSFTLKWFLSVCKTILYEVFLPQGYPQSVSNDYYDYQFWDSIQAFCSNITGILSTHSILKQAGVGDSSATALAATIVWILKDASSMISRITFAWWKGYMLDTDCKRWRFGADVINDIALGIEIMLSSALLKPISSIMLCISTCMKAIVGVAGGATRAAVTQHQAIRGNSGDVSAKDGSQEMCVNLIASFVGLFILTNIENSAVFIWVAYVSLTFIHLFSNYQAVHCLVMTTLNTERFNILIKHFMEGGIIENPEKVNKEESILLGCGLSDVKLCGYKIHVGSSIENVIKLNENHQSDIARIIHLNKHKRYFIFANDETNSVDVILRKGITYEEVLQAYFQAIIFALANNIYTESSTCLKSKLHCYAELKEMMTDKRTHSYENSGLFPNIKNLDDNIINKYWTPFLKGMKQKGWNMNGHQLIVDEWRLMLEE